MVKFSLMLSGLLILNISALFGQGEYDNIIIKKCFGTSFVQNGEKKSPKQLLEITKINTDAYNEMKISKSNYNITSIFGIVGGVFLAPLAHSILLYVFIGQHDYWGGAAIWTGIGVGLIAVSISYSTKYLKHAKKAIGIYNNQISDSRSRQGEINFGLIGNGIGMRITF